MNKIDKIVAPVFKVALIVYVLAILFRNEIRPDIYMLVIIPLQYCLGILLVYLGARWAIGKLQTSGNNLHKQRARTIFNLCGAMLLLLIVCVGGEYLLHRFSLTQEALRNLQNSKEGQTVLGDPIRLGWFIGIQMRMSGGDGAAALSIPVKGSRDGGDLEVRAVKKDGLWHVLDLNLITEHHKTIIRVSY